MNGLTLGRRSSFGRSHRRKSSFSVLSEVNSTVDSPEMVVSSSARSSSPDGALFEAVRQQRFRQATLLLEAGSDANAIRDRGESTLVYCCLQQEMPRQIQTKFVRLLLEHGADPNLTDDKGLTPLMHAAILGLKELAHCLLENDNTDPSMEDSDGNTAVIYAAMFGRRDILMSIVDKCRHTMKNLHLEGRNKQGLTALNMAIRGQHESCVRLLMREARQFPLVALEFPDPRDLERGPTPGALADDEDCLFDSSVELDEFEAPVTLRSESIADLKRHQIKEMFTADPKSKRQGESFWVYKFDGGKKFPKDSSFGLTNSPHNGENFDVGGHRRKHSISSFPFKEDDASQDADDDNSSPGTKHRTPSTPSDRPFTVVTRSDGQDKDQRPSEDTEDAIISPVKDSVVWHKSLRRFNKRCSKIYNSESLPCIVLATAKSNSRGGSRIGRKRASWTSGNEEHQFDLKSLIPKLKSSLGFHENGGSPVTVRVDDHHHLEALGSSVISGTVAN